jgi:4-hydroxy-3-polyprenylbenzoate decarboxylase
MPYYRDLREFVAELERRGKLWRYSEPIDKDTELIPFHRLQLRGMDPAHRRAILFERPVNARGMRYMMSVLTGIYGGSSDIHVLGLGCETASELQERWHLALTKPIDPVIVDSGPVHEEIHTGAELEELGLEAVPAPVEEPGFSGMIRTGTPMVTRDPITGKRNVAAFNAFFRSRTRMVGGFGEYRQSFQHFLANRKRGEKCPVAVVVGSTPNLMAAASANVPQDMDEYAAAGGLVGEPMELVRCKTIDLEVPASAELVIEGWFDPDVMEVRAPFGEYPGFINTSWDQCPVIHVTAITHRKNPMFTPILVGFTPSDTNILSGHAQAGILYHHLKYEQERPVVGVECPESAGGSQMCVIRMQSGKQDEAWEALEAAPKHIGSKWLIAVDEDVYPSEPELLLWALTYSIRSPKDAFRYQMRRGPGLDPSGDPPDGGKNELWAKRAADSPLTVGLINAVRSWDYPPVALPAKEYMDRALEIWKRTPGAPELNLREPWHGYELGYWPELFGEIAQLMADGDFLKAGELLLEYQTPLTDKAAEKMTHA